MKIDQPSHKNDSTMNQNVGLRSFNKWAIDHAVLIVLATAVLVIASYAIVFRQWPISENPSGWGNFGDLIGGLLNPLVSTFTLIVALQVWRLQREELALTRQELIKQSETSDIQRKEQRFFDCMALYQRALDSQSAKVNSASQGTEHFFGKEALFVWAGAACRAGEIKQFTSPAITRLVDKSDTSKPVPLSDIREKLIRIRKKLGLPKTDAYCRSVFQLLQFIVDVLGPAAPRYISIFREQLSEEELCLLTFYLLFTTEGDQYWSIVTRAHLLRNLDIEGVAPLAREYLPSEAFIVPDKEY